MNKLILVVPAVALALTGCGGTQKTAQPLAAVTTTVTAPAVTAPAVTTTETETSTETETVTAAPTVHHTAACHQATAPRPTATHRPAPKPVPKPAPKPAPKPTQHLDPRYGTCKEANAHGYGNYRVGVDPEYWWYIDRDHDGIDCEF